MAINFHRCENSAILEARQTIHVGIRDPIGSPLSLVGVWARVYAPTRVHLPERDTHVRSSSDLRCCVIRVKDGKVSYVSVSLTLPKIQLSLSAI